MSQTLRVVTAFGPFAVNQIITDPGQVAAILAGPYAADVVDAAQGSGDNAGSGGSGSGSGGSGSNGGSTPSPGVTLAQVDTEIATKVPPLITAAIAAQGTGQGVSASQSVTNALIFG